jgi:hypothetical protein
VLENVIALSAFGAVSFAIAADGVAWASMDPKQQLIADRNRVITQQLRVIDGLNLHPNRAYSARAIAECIKNHRPPRDIEGAYLFRPQRSFVSVAATRCYWRPRPGAAAASSYRSDDLLRHLHGGGAFLHQLVQRKGPRLARRPLRSAHESRVATNAF